MAFPTAVNNQITDSITQTNVKVLGEAPAQAIATLYQAAANSAGLAIQNAVASQKNGNDLSVAVTSKCINALLGQPK